MTRQIVEGKNTEINKDSTWKQSANSLINFMRRREYLEMILRNMAIIPRYYIEYVDYLNIDTMPRVAFPMTCFCDIPLNKLSSHIEFYGKYGIGLDKEGWGIKKGIQPVKYVNPESDLLKDFIEAFTLALDNKIKIPEECMPLKDYLVSELVYMKPIKGVMDRSGVEKSRIFKDECEWRYIPRITESMEIPLILPLSVVNNAATSAYSEVLKAHQETWLDFKVDDIKYIVVPNEQENTAMIDFIYNELENLTNSTRLQLISKLFVMDRFQEDI